jgi:hypothetical protein
VETASAKVTGGTDRATATCKTGVVVGGGFKINGVSPTAIIGVKASEPTPTTGQPTGWTAEVEQLTGVPISYELTVYVVCAP